VEGENLAIEYYSAEGQVDRLPRVVSDMIRRPVAAIAANGIAALAAKTATTTIPIVFATGGDPVEQGLVSLSMSAVRSTLLWLLQPSLGAVPVRRSWELARSHSPIGRD
jgi:putative ABC transport system substrate-binding protein